MDKIKAAQKALTDAQNNAKAALNDYADNILDTYEGKLTAKQARDIAAAVDAGEEAIDAAAKTGVNDALMVPRRPSTRWPRMLSTRLPTRSW